MAKAIGLCSMLLIGCYIFCSGSPHSDYTKNGIQKYEATHVVFVHPVMESVSTLPEGVSFASMALVAPMITVDRPATASFRIEDRPILRRRFVKLIDLHNNGPPR